MLKKLYPERLGVKGYWIRIILFIIILFLIRGVIITISYFYPLIILIYFVIFLSILKWNNARIKDSGINRYWGALSIIFLLTLIYVPDRSLLTISLIIISILYIIVFSKPSIPQEIQDERMTTENVDLSSMNAEKLSPKSSIEIWFEKRLKEGHNKEDLLREMVTQGYPEEFVNKLGEKY